MAINCCCRNCNKEITGRTSSKSTNLSKSKGKKKINIILLRVLVNSNFQNFEQIPGISVVFSLLILNMHLPSHHLLVQCQQRKQQKMHELCSKLIIKTTEQGQCQYSAVVICLFHTLI